MTTSCTKYVENVYNLPMMGEDVGLNKLHMYNVVSRMRFELVLGV